MSGKSTRYEQVSSLLASQQILQPAAEVHGLVCGQVCSGTRIFDPDIAGQILGLEELSATMRDFLARFAQEIRDQLADAEMGFQPLLPDDEKDLASRALALGNWCDGFNV
ncbi:MAG: UPF0149 family protein, partial [Pseudohongiellaceae bacterium]